MQSREPKFHAIPRDIKMSERTWKDTPGEDAWMSLVRRYSERKLSCATDKLVAISALAQAVIATLPVHQGGIMIDDQVLRSTYLAGVFRIAN